MSIEMNSVNTAAAVKAPMASAVRVIEPQAVSRSGTDADVKVKKIDFGEQQQQLQEAIDRVNEMMRKNGRALNFSIDKVAQRTVITVKNLESGEVVRQIPDEALLRVAHTIEELKGLLYHEST